MFNSYIVLAGYDMVTDANMAATRRRNSKRHLYKQKYKKSRAFRKRLSRKNLLTISGKIKYTS